MSAEPCHLLRLPTELRLHIYDYALCDAEAITISSGEVIDYGFGVYPDDGCAEESIGRRHKSIPGLPANHVPIIRRHYDQSLLSITSPAVVLPPGSASLSSPAESFTDSAYASATSLASSSQTSTEAPDANTDSSWDAIPLSTPLSLLATCRTINAELQSHLQFQKTTTAQYGPALYVSYPTGLLVLKALCSHLLAHARAVYIAGAYHVSAPIQPPGNESALSRRLARLDGAQDSYSRHATSANDPILSRRPCHFHVPTPEATAALASTVRTLLGPHPHPTLQKLQLRIYYPSEHSYRYVWGDDSSPIVVALQNTWGGNIETEVWRGRWGTGVKFEARSNVESRVMSSVWRRLTEKKQSEAFVVGKEWPEDSEGSKVGERGKNVGLATVSLRRER